MNQHNLLQIFSATSVNIGVSTPEELARVIHDEKLSEYFPLSNTGLHADVVRQEAAAKKYGLKPRYGRTFTLDPAAGSIFRRKRGELEYDTLQDGFITMYAMTAEGRDWLYQLTESFKNLMDVMRVFRVVPEKGVMAFLDPAWLTESSSAVRVALSYIKEKLDGQVFIAVNTLIHGRSKVESPGLKCVYYRPVCSATYDNVEAISFTDKVRGASLLSVYRLLAGLFDRHGERIEECGDDLAEMQRRKISNPFLSQILADGVVLSDRLADPTPDNAVPMDALFSQCEDIDTVESVLAKHATRRRKMTLRDWVDNDGEDNENDELLSINDTLSMRLMKFVTGKKQGHAVSYKLIQQYNDRLSEEMALVEMQGHAALIHDAINLSNAVATLDHPVYLRGNAGCSFILHILGLTLVDPVANHLEPELFYCRDAGGKLHFDAQGRDAQRIAEQLQAKTSMSVMLSARETKVSPFKHLKMAIKGRSYAHGIEAEMQFHKRAMTDGDFFMATQDGRINKIVEQIAKNTDLPEPKEALSAGEKGLLHNMSASLFSYHLLPVPGFAISPVSEDGAVGLTSEELNALGLGTYQVLGLATLGVIRETLENTPFKSIEDIPLLDPTGGAKALYLSGKTSGIFHAESDGIKPYFKYLNGDGIHAVADILALYRPGPLDAEMMKVYTADEPVQHGHEGVDTILSRSRGVLIYQEQALSLLKGVLGLPYDKAIVIYDLASKGELGDTGVLDLHPEIDDAGAAEIVGKLLVAYGKHLFSEAHALTYATYSYCQAYLLTHYAKEAAVPMLNQLFGRANMSAQDKLGAIIDMAEIHGIEFAGIDENTSFSKIRVTRMGNFVVPASNTKPVRMSQLKWLHEQMKKQASRGL